MNSPSHSHTRTDRWTGGLVIGFWFHFFAKPTTMSGRVLKSTRHALHTHTHTHANTHMETHVYTRRPTHKQEHTNACVHTRTHTHRLLSIAVRGKNTQPVQSSSNLTRIKWPLHTGTTTSHKHTHSHLHHHKHTRTHTRTQMQTRSRNTKQTSS